MTFPEALLYGVKFVGLLLLAVAWFLLLFMVNADLGMDWPPGWAKFLFTIVWLIITVALMAYFW